MKKVTSQVPSGTFSYLPSVHVDCILQGVIEARAYLQVSSTEEEKQALLRIEKRLKMISHDVHALEDILYDEAPATKFNLE